MTPKTEPTVSVVIPAYNAAWCVGRAVDSVLAQSFRDFELIVVDDGSTDDTASVLGAYGSALKVISKSNGGMSSARNAGIGVATGEFVAFLDSDDWWHPEKLARQVERMRAQPSLAFCAASANLEDPDGNSVGRWACIREEASAVEDVFAGHSAVAGGASAVLAKRQLVEHLGGFDETLFGAEDTDLWIRLAAHGGFACISEPLVVVLKRPDSVSRNRNAMRAGAIAMTIKNRELLRSEYQGAFWRALYAGTLCDYAKWAYRDGDRIAALADLLKALSLAPLSRGRLIASLTLAVLTNRSI